MIRIGLTGISGSGKSFVTKIFAQYDIPSINADAVVHELYRSKNPCTEKMVDLFGNDILLENHSIDRKKLAAIVFSSREKLELLNYTVHPFVIDKIEQTVKEKENQGIKAVLIEAPQLFEAGLQSMCDYVVSVISDHETRIERLIARDGITREMAEKRISNQYGNEFFRSHSDYCIENNSSDDLDNQVRSMLIKFGLVS